jgi:hypothetical protein
MSDDFCIEHGYEFMRCEKVWGAIPYCAACEVREAKERASALVDWLEQTKRRLENMKSLTEDAACPPGDQP